MRDVLFLITSACLLSAATFRPPKLGYIYDPDAAAIRVISGVSGAAAVEETVATGSKLAFAAVAPGARYALVRLRDAAGVSVLQFDSGSMSALDGASATGDLIAFSAGAASAAIWTGERIQVWTGLPESPALARELAAEEVTALAVADDAAAVAASTRTGTLLWEGSDSARALAPAAALVFVPGSHDLVVAEESGNRLSAIRGAETDVLATEKDGIAGAVALAIASDGRTLAVANANGGSVAVVNLSTHEVGVTQCDCTPRELLALSGDRLFALRAANGGVRLLDAGRGELSLFLLSPAGGER
ncbi:MAG TPA: hypothetical protein VFL57_02070 [Bryobacteraceae bacterium]|nr:hypothetical protein [Bryobacteraceae bacterium]